MMSYEAEIMSAMCSYAAAANSISSRMLWSLYSCLCSSDMPAVFFFIRSRMHMIVPATNAAASIQCLIKSLKN